MNKSLEWLKRELSCDASIPDSSQGMRNWRNKILNSREVIIFGAGGAGSRARRILHKHNVKTAFFLDNRPSATQDGVRVFSPDDAPAADLPIIVASAWFVEIVQQLQLFSAKFDMCNIFPMPDVLQLDSEIYDDAAGYPFLEVLENRLDDFKRVADLYEDDESRTRFIKLLLYRVCFFQAQNLSSRLLPCSAREYEQAENITTPVTLPTALSDEVKTLIKYQYAHPSYWQEGFMRPRKGDIVIDGGAWYGDTAFWYLTEMKNSGHVFAIEPGERASRELRETVVGANLQSEITVVRKALGRGNGKSAWKELDDATPCSHVAGEGDDIDVISIDGFVASNGVNKIDTIKLDVEGADFAALQGSSVVIERDRPDLAISVYHSAHHLVDIPLWISSRNLGYRMRLSHNQLSISETVCLATCRGVD